jgi:hypothetical protein
MIITKGLRCYNNQKGGTSRNCDKLIAKNVKVIWLFKWS